MAIEAELADGRILEFPDGTNPAVIQATVKRVLGLSVAATPAPAAPPAPVAPPPPPPPVPAPTAPPPVQAVAKAPVRQTASAVAPTKDTATSSYVGTMGDDFERAIMGEAPAEPVEPAEPVGKSIFERHRDPITGKVVPAVKVEPPQVDPQKNLETMRRSGSPDSVMFTPGQQLARAQAEIERGKARQARIRQQAEAKAAAKKAALADQAQEEGYGPTALAKDVALGLGAKGLAAGVASGAGLASLATGWIPDDPRDNPLRIGQWGELLDKLGYNSSKIDEFITGFQSPQSQLQQQEVKDAKGFVNSLYTTAVNPLALLDTVAQSIPSMFLGGAAGGALFRKLMADATNKAAALKLTGAAAEKFIANRVISQGTAAGIGEGVLTAGSTAEKAREAGVDYKDYVLPALAAGAGTAAIGVASGKIGEKFGIGDVDTAIAARFSGLRGKTGSDPSMSLLQGLKTALKEGLLEEMPQSAQEQVFSNLAMGKPWDEGVPEAAAQGLVAGLATAGGYSASVAALQKTSKSLAGKPQLSAEQLARSKGFLTPEGKQRNEPEKEEVDLGDLGRVSPGDEDARISALAEELNVPANEPIKPAPASLFRSFDETEKEEADKILANLRMQNIPDDSARRIAAARIVENRKRKIREAIVEPTEDEIQQRVKELIDVGMDPVRAFDVAQQQILDEREADALAETEDQGTANVNQPISGTGGAGAPVAGQPSTERTPAGVGAAKPGRVVSAGPDAAKPDTGKTVQQSALAEPAEEENKYLAVFKGTKAATTTTQPFRVGPANDATQGRVVVLKEVNGVKVPFYISTGRGGKKGVATGQWYPYFGTGPDGWFNKGTEALVNNFYNTPELRTAAAELNKTLGDIRPDMATLPTAQELNIDPNVDVNPVANGDANALNNIQTTVKKIKAGAPKVTKAEIMARYPIPKDLEAQIAAQNDQKPDEPLKAATPTETETPEVSREDKLKTATDAELQAAITKIGGSDISLLSVPTIQAEIDRRSAEKSKKRAPGGGRKPLPPGDKAAKETDRKEGRKTYTAAERRFSGNKNSLLSQLDTALAPIDEGEMESEAALEQAKRDKAQEKLFVVKELIALEAAHRGTALGNRVKAVLNDKSKVSAQDIERAKRSKTRQETVLEEAQNELNAANQAEAGTYTTKPRFSESRKDQVRKANPKLKGEMTAAQALTIIAKSGSWFQRLLANRLRQFVPNVRVVVLEAGEPLPERLAKINESPKGRWNGLFIPGVTPTIYVTGESFGDLNGQNNITVLHEILHAALNGRLYLGMAVGAGLNTSAGRAAKEFSDKIIRLMEYARKAYSKMEDLDTVPKGLRIRVESTLTKDKNTGEFSYEIFTSPDEFLSYALTEPLVQKFLNGLDSIERAVSAYSDFVNAAARLLGIGKGKDGQREVSALTDLLDATDRLLDVNVPEDLARAVDESLEEEGTTFQAKKPKAPPPASIVSPTEDEYGDPIRAAAELKETANIAKETVAVSRAGEEGKGIKKMQMARDPKKVVAVLKELVQRNWQDMSPAAIRQLTKLPSMPFLAKWSGIKSLEDVDRYMQAMSGMASSLQAGSGQILVTLGKELNPLFKSAKKFRTNFENLVYETTIQRVDPSDPKARERTARADELWASVGPKGQKLYVALKQHYENLIDLYSDLLDQQVMAIQGMAPEAKANLVKVLRQTFEAGARIRPYFPLVRRGDYWVRTEEMVGDGKNKKPVKAFYMFEKVSDRAAFMREYAAERKDDVENLLNNGVLDTGDTMAGLRAQTANTSAMLTQVFDEIDKNDFDSPEAKEALKDAVYQVYLSTMPEQKFRSQFMHRQDRAGFSTDLLQNMATTAANTSMHLAKLKYAPLLRNALDAARAAAKGNDNLTPFVKETQLRVNLALEGKQEGLGQALAGLANKVSYFWFLSSASSALIQPFSLYISALPVLGANHKNMFKAAKTLAKNMGYLKQYSMLKENPDGTTSFVAPSLVNNTSLSELERDAIREMGQRGVSTSTYTAEIYGYRSTPTAQASTLLGKTTKLGAKAADLLVGSLMHNVERLTREVTYLSAYQLGVGRGLNHEAAINQAIADVNESLGNYDLSARPRWMQTAVGKFIGQFKTYPLHISLYMGTNLVKMIPFLNKEGKRAAATKFFGTYLAAGSIAGASGLPVFGATASALAAILKAMQSDDDWPEELKDMDPDVYFRTIFLPEKLGDVTIGGIPVADILDSGPLNALTGMAIAERIGLNDLWGRDTKETKSTREGMLNYLSEKAGPSVSLALTVGDALDAYAVGDYAKVLDKLSPAVIRNVRFAMRLGEEGIKDSSGKTVIPPEEISTLRMLGQAIGFRPAISARMADVGFKLMSVEQKINNERTRLITEAKIQARRIADGKDVSEKDMEKLQEKINKFEDTHPDYEIEDLDKIIDDDLEKRGESRLGVSVSDRNARFTDRPLYYLEKRIERENAKR